MKPRDRIKGCLRRNRFPRVQALAFGLALFLPAVAFGNIGNHSLFIKDNGSLHSMGQNNNGQLGTGNTTDKNSPTQIVASGVAQVAAGRYHSLFLK